MKSLTIFGVRVMTERAWTATIDDAARERALRCEVGEQLRQTIADGKEFAEGIQKLTEEGREQIKAAVRQVLLCNEALKVANVHLAHRAEVAEHEAAQARKEQADAERIRRRLYEVVDHVERFCDNPDTVAWVQHRSGLRQP